MYVNKTQTYLMSIIIWSLMYIVKFQIL